MSIEAVAHPATTLRFRLRAATDALHRATERQFALERRFASRAAYRDLLAALYGFHVPLEAALRSIDWGTGAGLAARLCKSQWLADDLSALGLADAAISALPRCGELPALPSRSAGFGALYVVEGATLGGQLIVKQLQQRLGIGPGTGGYFFASYGSQIGPMWRAFVAALDTHDADHAAVERAARATFRAFGAWLPPESAP